MHDDLFHHHLWTSAAVSMHTKQGWKGANQDAMTVSQVNTHDFSLPIHLPEGLASAPLLTNILGLLRLLCVTQAGITHTSCHQAWCYATMATLICLPAATCIQKSSPFLPHRHTVASATLFYCLTTMHRIHLDLLQPEMHLIFQPPVSWVLCAVQLHLEGKVRSISALLKAEILQLNEICRENIEILYTNSCPKLCTSLSLLRPPMS